MDTAHPFLLDLAKPQFRETVVMILVSGKYFPFPVGVTSDKCMRGRLRVVPLSLSEGGVRVCGDAVLRYFWCGYAVIFVLTRGIAVSKH